MLFSRWFVCVICWSGVSFIRLLIKDNIFQDCWMSHNRTSDGQLQPDHTRFPNGMKALGDYVSMLLLPYSFNACLVSPRFHLYQSWSCLPWCWSMLLTNISMDSQLICWRSISQVVWAKCWLINGQLTVVECWLSIGWVWDLICQPICMLVKCRSNNDWHS